MAICDLCNDSAGGNSKRYSCAQFRSAVRAGLRPGNTMSAMGAVFGLSTEESSTGWIQQVMSDSSDWVLCGTCAQKADRYV